MRKMSKKPIKPSGAPAPGIVTALYEFTNKPDTTTEIAYAPVATVGYNMKAVSGKATITNGKLVVNDDCCWSAPDPTSQTGAGGIKGRFIHLIDFTPSLIAEGLYIISNAVGAIYGQNNGNVYIKADGSIADNLTGVERILATAGTLQLNTPTSVVLDLGEMRHFRNFGCPSGDLNKCFRGTLNELRLTA